MRFSAVDIAYFLIVGIEKYCTRQGAWSGFNRREFGTRPCGHDA